MGGNLGYELDLGKLTFEEKDEVRRQVAFYKEHRDLVQFGDFYRLASPFSSSAAAWIFVSPDKTRAWASYHQAWTDANLAVPFLKLKGLNPRATYTIGGLAKTFGGDELMEAGLRVHGLSSDCQSCSWLLNCVE